MRDFQPYVAFRWVGGPDTGGLAGIDHPDPICLEDLIGYAEERAVILENTEQFLDGYPANNVLLYGERGTGKSSTVKALLHAYAPQGLRLVEVAKDDLTDFPAIIRSLQDRPQRFIIFVDDLSFDDQEPAYKAMKTVLEGGLAARPDNVLIYATSNRRHLIQENFAERQGDEVHVRDSMEEKLSLADRFGLTVIFGTPDQEGYLEIVEGLAAQRGLKVDRAELRQMALRWAMRQNGRSGRSARQFIAYLTGKLRF